MAVVFDKPHALADVPMHDCPGCLHGVVHRLVAEVIDELGIEGRTIGIAPVGCSVMAYNYFNCDMIEAAHGRAPAVKPYECDSLRCRCCWIYHWPWCSQQYDSEKDKSGIMQSAASFCR